MKLIRFALRATNDGLLCNARSGLMGRAFSTNAAFANNENANAPPFESDEDFENRIFGARPEDSSNSFFKKVQRLESSSARSSMASLFEDGLEETLKKEAAYFKMTEEVDEDDYTYRPDMNFQDGQTYDTKASNSFLLYCITPLPSAVPPTIYLLARYDLYESDVFLTVDIRQDLDLTKPGVWKPTVPDEFEVTTKEVLQKADFRNVRFLANFITDAGIIIKRNKTKISAKAQRKVAREIKTARAFGLLPFTTMGTKAYVFGRTMQNLDEDYEHYRYDFVAGGIDDDPSPYVDANPVKGRP
ncbi:Small ribosomal subunit protein bS18-like protein [Drosera capensis]